MDSYNSGDVVNSETKDLHVPCEHCSVDTSSSSVFIIAASILIGAILVSASVFGSIKMAVSQLNNATATVSNKQAAVAAQAPGTPTAAVQAAPVKLTLKPDVPFLGNKDAKVTVVEYADYRCPFCEKWYTSVMPDLKAKYIGTNKIKFIYQDFAFLGPDSNTAAEASHCAADQNKFWQYHDYLFAHQGSESGDWASAANQKTFAKALGLNASQFNQCLDSGKYKQEVLDETAAGKKYGVSGTPSVFVNGQIIVGAQPLSTFIQAIDAALMK
jgi:protein-disulfide isomerase